jgi:hypothetical protein
MFIKSIRWRLLLWLGFLLLVLLGGFAFTSFQLNRIHRFRQIDEELTPCSSREHRSQGGTAAASSVAWPSSAGRQAGRPPTPRRRPGTDQP